MSTAHEKALGKKLKVKDESPDVGFSSYHRRETTATGKPKRHKGRNVFSKTRTFRGYEKGEAPDVRPEDIPY